MPKITYVEYSGQSHSVDGKAGATIMQTARDNNVPGIDADCGGACACGTCQVYVAAEWLERTGARSPMEETMLSFTENNQENSRLSCQITLTDQLSGIIVTIPEMQN